MNAISKQKEFLNCQLCEMRKENMDKCPAFSYIYEIREMAKKEYANLCRERLEIYKKISSITDTELKTLLEYRFIYKMTYQKIAEITNYSLRQVMRKIHDACEIFAFLS